MTDLRIYWLQARDILRRGVKAFKDNTVEISIIVVSASTFIAYLSDDVNKAFYALTAILLFAINDVRRSIVNKIVDVHGYSAGQGNEKMEVR